MLITSITAFAGVLLWAVGSYLLYSEYVAARSAVEIALLAAVTGGAVVAVWSWFFRHRLRVGLGSSMIRGVVCAVVLVAVFEISGPLRSTIATTWFPYITELRFGLPGAFLIWLILDVAVIGVLLFLMAERNLTTRWSGP